MRRLAVALMLLPLAGAAAAEEGDSSVFAGYSLLASEENHHGWHAALAVGLTGPERLLVEVSGHEGTNDNGTDESTLSVMAGPRVVVGQGRVRGFVHVIGGLVRTKTSVGIYDVQISETSNHLGGAAGGGLDVGLSRRWAARLALDYRIASIDEEVDGDPRFSAGVVYRFGH